jgi:hypothetical protein
MSKHRKLKRLMNQYMKRINYGKYFIDCRYHPCKVTEYFIRSEDPYGSYVDGISLVDNSGTSCSCYYCRPEPISKELALEMSEFAKNNNWNEYLTKYLGFSTDAVNQYNKLDEVWNFNKGSN